jgi:hypothetical protein
MGTTYTRQSSGDIVDGSTIEASHFNDEFDQLLAAFVAATGHTHDGTAAEGGPVTKLLGTSLTIGDGTAGTDITLTFDGETSNGVLTWMEDEDLFKFTDTINVGVDDAGHDVKFFGDTASRYWLWDTSADGVVQLGTLTVGVDDAGYDVKFFGNTASAYMLWDTSTDDLVLAGAAGIDLAGDIDVDGTANLDAVDIDGAVQIDATFTSGVDGQGYDTKFFGDTSSAYMLWDTSEDDLVLAGAAGIDLAGDIDVDGTANLDNTDIDGTLAVDGTTISLDASTSLNIDNSNTSNGITIATATSGVPISIGHATSETTVNDNLTVTGTLTGTLATAAQGSVTSLGTLTALTVDDVAINGKVVTMTGSASDTAVFTAGTNGTLDITTTDAAAAAANIQITADGTVDIDSVGVLTLDSGAAINIEPASGSAILLDGTISVDAGVVTGATSITSTAFVGALTGNASGTAATVTTAAQTNITSLGTLTTLTVDNVIINGTTIGHTSDTDLLTLADAAVTALGTITVGVDNTGHDVKFFGASAGAYALWDESANLLDLRGATAAGPGHLKLTTGELDVVDADVLGKIEFQAPLESDGSDAVLVGAAIWAEADDTFAAGVNNTDLVFALGKSEAAAEKFRFTADNEIGIAGANYGTDGQVLTSGGAGNAVAWEDAASSAADDITAGDAAVSLSTSSGNVTIDSNAGAVTVDGHTGVTLQSTDSGDITLDSVADIILDADGANITFKDGGNTVIDFVMNYGTNVLLDCPNDLDLDAAGGQISFWKAGTEWLRTNELSGGVVLRGMVSDADFKIMGNDDGAAIDMLVFDVSEAGAATFTSTVIAAGGQLTTTGKAMVLGF